LVLPVADVAGGADVVLAQHESADLVMHDHARLHDRISRASRWRAAILIRKVRGTHRARV